MGSCTTAKVTEVVYPLGHARNGPRQLLAPFLHPPARPLLYFKVGTRQGVFRDPLRRLPVDFLNATLFYTGVTQDEWQSVKNPVYYIRKIYQ